MVEPYQLEELLPLSDPAVQRLLGVDRCVDPYQAAGRIIRSRQVPHLRIGRRIRVSLPALRAWAAEQIAQSVPARADAQ
ncbi:MAG TPA: hypothetical protein VKN18_25970 [Blastocatellia bacterium]|nr:hypothetical protein [Blastocatellia bacterium]